MQLIQDIDYAVIGYLNAFAGRNPAFDALIFDVADSAVVQGGLFMAIFWWIWFEPGPEQQKRRQTTVVGIAGALIAVLVSRILQLALPFHLRPLHTPGLHFVVPAGVNPQSLNDWNSFPSDHAVLTFAMATAIWYRSRALGLLAGAWSLVIVCLPRIYLGYHYPSDVAGGAVIGVLLMLAARRVFAATPFPTLVLRWEETRRTVFYCLAFACTFEIGVMFYDVRHLARDGIAVTKSIVDQDDSLSTAGSRPAPAIPASTKP